MISFYLCLLLALPQQDRIVDGRPALYAFKRAIHPVTWVGAAARPFVRSAESGRIKSLLSRPANPNIRFGLNGAGPGSGFGLQLTLARKNLLGHGIEVEVPLLYTYKQYERYEFNTRVPFASETFVDRLTFDFGGAYNSRASEGFFGIGNDSRVEDQTHFRSITREALAGFSADINDEWKSGVHLSYRNTGIDRLSEGAELRSTRWSVDHDTRDKDEGLPFGGGIEHVEASINEGIGKGDFSYWKYRFEFQRFFALTSDRRKVIALRGMAETNQEKGGSGVPFFDMPVLGNWDTIRGFENYRFYDKSAMSVGIEYRYRIWRPMDGALFVDAGQVAPEPGDFGFNRFHTGYGVRMIAMPKPNFPITVDIARSREKWRWYVNFNPKF